MQRRYFLKGASALLGAKMLSMSSTSAKTKAEFYWPEETAPHERTFMQWPVNRKIHTDRVFLNMLQMTIADIANTISEFEPVVMLMADKYQASAQRKLGKNVEIWNIATDDLWCRDSGPLFVTDGNGKLAIAHLKFNGWGNKQRHANDGKITKRVAQRMGVELINSGLTGEGGGIETDGNGTLLAHESCWVNPNRNTMDREAIGRRLKRALGAQKIIWAPGLKGADITDYHIDTLVRFVRPGEVVIQLPAEQDKGDPWSLAAFETYNTIRAEKDANGQQIEIIVLPEPRKTRIKTDDFVASYVNYYACNGAIIMPQFGDRKADAEAKSILKRLYPDRDIVALNIDPIGEIGGGIHCATQQQVKV